MGGSLKSKRVAWASDVNLCQVKLFLSEDSPSQVGLGTQEHLQAKRLGPSGGNRLDDNLPPGFEGVPPANLWKVQLSQIPSVMWKCPPKFQVDSEWAVVAGEESLEMEAQNQREMRMLEAIYPRPSAIPSNPSASMGVEDSSVNNQSPPLIPITPVEDEDTTLDSYSSIASISNPPISHHQHLTLQGVAANENLAPYVGPDIVAAAQAALTSVMPNNNQGNLIDRDLLIKILSDPNMVGQLLTNHGASSAAQTAPSPSTPNVLNSTPKGMPAIGGQAGSPSITKKLHMPHTPSNILSSSLQSITSTVHNVTSASTQLIPSLMSSPDNSFDPVSAVSVRRDTPLSSTYISLPEVSHGVGTTGLAFNPPNRNLRPSTAPDTVPASSSASAPMLKDINYYKSLIQQHGGERRENTSQFTHQSFQASGTSQEIPSMPKSRDVKHKMMKPCIFFNSSKGCRNGANCPYLHEAYPQQNIGSIPDVQSAKRMKINGDTGS